MIKSYEFKVEPDFIPRGLSILRRNRFSSFGNWHRVGRISDTKVITFYRNVSNQSEQDEILEFLRQENLL